LQESFDPCLARAPDQPTADPGTARPLEPMPGCCWQARLITRDLTAYLTA